MKIRKGFVSNSSSSSYICDVCGRDESGMDMCLSEAYMVKCKNGHIVCEDHIDVFRDIREKLEEEMGGDYRYDFPKEHCPICTLESIRDTDVLRYVLTKNEQERKEIEKELKSRFNNLDELDKYIKDGEIIKNSDFSL